MRPHTKTGSRPLYQFHYRRKPRSLKTVGGKYMKSKNYCWRSTNQWGFQSWIDFDHNSRRPQKREKLVAAAAAGEGKRRSRRARSHFEYRVRRIIIVLLAYHDDNAPLQIPTETRARRRDVVVENTLLVCAALAAIEILVV